MDLEGTHRLVHKRDAVGQEEDALDPVAAGEQVDQGYDGSRLSRTGGHAQQRLALVVRVKRLPDVPDGPLLVVALDDGGVDRGPRQRLAGLAPLDRELQFVLGKEALNLPRGVPDV